MGWRVRRRTSVSQGGRWRTVDVDWTVASGWSVVGIKLAGAGSRLQVVVRIGEVK